MVEKGEIAQNEQFYLLPQCFLCNLNLEILFLATSQLSSAASSNLGSSQNGVLGNGVKFINLNYQHVKGPFYMISRSRGLSDEMDFYMDP